ncbi:Hypothetical protein NTJ_00307 [Nesidiocoris tenuis]|uniref:Uncharacterized protein n=1 Tax=Nesidiocoris tenuis TaxID=355587 RepID=A0ABN7A5M7_9HEMI|nr:Hypothetical protein NTJ_00307 [Nesidiocoris tenuis]
MDSKKSWEDKENSKRAFFGWKMARVESKEKQGRKRRENKRKLERAEEREKQENKKASGEKRRAAAEAGNGNGPPGGCCGEEVRRRRRRRIMIFLLLLFGSALVVVVAWYCRGWRRWAAPAVKAEPPRRPIGSGRRAQPACPTTFTTTPRRSAAHRPRLLQICTWPRTELFRL